MTRAASIAEPATIIVQLETAPEKVKAGSLRQARPGARILAIVTARLIDWSTTPRTVRPTAMIQTSTPLFEMKTVSESGGQELKPASGGRVDEAHVEEGRRRRCRARGEREQPRKGERASADLERDDVGVEAESEREGEEHDQRRAAHGEQAVEGDRLDQVVLGDRQLKPDQQEGDDAEDEEGERRADVDAADVLVVGAHHHLEPARAHGAGPVGDELGPLRREGASVAHQPSPFACCTKVWAAWMPARLLLQPGLVGGHVDDVDAGAHHRIAEAPEKA